MRSPTDLRTWAERRFANQHREWLGQLGLGAEQIWAFALHPPTQQSVAADPDRVARWIETWTRFRLPAGTELEWATRSWSSVGRQRVPVRVRGEGAEPVADLAGRAPEWARGAERVWELRRRWPDAGSLGPALTGTARPLIALDDKEFVQLCDVLGFLANEPDSGLWVRELPIPGIDSKWLERHRRLVEVLHAGITGRDDTGLARAATRFRVRMLDPALAVRGLTDFTAPIEELNAVPLQPRTVVVCENLTTVHSLPPLPGGIALHGHGRAVTLLTRLRWLEGSRILYWGDLDTHGFAILSQFRQEVPTVESLLMDAQTLETHRPLCVLEPVPFRGDITHLTASEYEALRLVRADDLRLEQERIPWAYARPRVLELAADSGAV